jgi:hypothetical protein
MSVNPKPEELMKKERTPLPAIAEAVARARD